jgi:lipid A 3-O-deacylase
LIFHRNSFCAAAVALAVCLTAGTARAQLQSISARADNDAFNFWKPAYDRPDEEYTSGVRGTLTYFGAASWERWLHPDVKRCEKSDSPCASHEFSIGQDMYTGKLVPGDTTRVPGTRPNAAWLYLQESSRFVTVDRLDESSITIGVTGPPALGEQMQNFFHSLAPAYNRPTNWTVQLPFEPGVIAAFDRTLRVLALPPSEGFGGDVEPHFGASAGNILTEARAGLRIRAGLNVQHPWEKVAISDDAVVTFFGDVTGHAILRNEFLDGTMFSSSPHVTKRPLTADYSAGLSVRVQRLTISYSLDQITPEYTTRPNGHAWSRIAAEWRIER